MLWTPVENQAQPYSTYVAPVIYEPQSNDIGLRNTVITAEDSRLLFRSDSIFWLKITFANVA
jgi:hypothetical protein